MRITAAVTEKLCHSDLAARDGRPSVIGASLGAMAPRASLGLVGVPADPAASCQPSPHRHSVGDHGP